MVLASEPHFGDQNQSAEWIDLGPLHMLNIKLAWVNGHWSFHYVLWRFWQRFNMCLHEWLRSLTPCLRTLHSRPIVQILSRDHPDVLSSDFSLTWLLFLLSANLIPYHLLLLPLCSSNVPTFPKRVWVAIGHSCPPILTLLTRLIYNSVRSQEVQSRIFLYAWTL